MLQRSEYLVLNNPIKHAAGGMLSGRIRICVGQIGRSIIPSEALTGPKPR